MVNEPQRQGDIEAPNRFRVQIVHGEAPELEIEPEHLADKERLAHMLTLAIHAQDAPGAAAFRFHAIETAVTADIEHAFARQVLGQTLPDDFPGFAGVIDGFAHHAFGLGENAIAEIDAMKPGLMELQPTENLLVRHGDQRVWRMAAAACSAPVTSIRVIGIGISGEKNGSCSGVWAPATR